MIVNQRSVRALSLDDAIQVGVVFESRPRSSLVGVSWTLDSILNEINCSASLGLFTSSSSLNAFVIYKNLGSVLEILLIFSKKDSKGAGKQLLDHLINAHGQVDGIWLEVHEDNQKAIQFYERLGFQRVSVRRGYYPEDKQAFNYNLTIDRKSK